GVVQSGGIHKGNDHLVARARIRTARGSFPGFRTICSREVLHAPKGIPPSPGWRGNNRTSCLVPPDTRTSTANRLRFARPWVVSQLDPIGVTVRRDGWSRERFCNSETTEL